MKRRLQRHENISGYLFILPGFIGFFGLVFLPMVFSLVLSLTQWSLTSGFGAIRITGIQNFIDLFSDYQFVAALRNTVIFTLTTVPTLIALGITFAVLIRDLVFGKAFVRTLIFIPYVSSVVAVSVVWLVLFFPSNGPINETLKVLGISNPPRWFGDVRWALPATVLETIWLNLGYYVVVYMAGLTTISRGLYEAAEIDGAGYFRRFFTITVPGVSPTTFFLVVIGMINSFKVFGQIMVTTHGGPGTATLVFAVYIYQLGFLDDRMGYASAVAWIAFIVILAIALIQMRQQRNAVSYLM